MSAFAAAECAAALAASLPRDGVLRVDRRRCIRACDSAASRILSAADALAEAGGRLVALRPVDDARLQQAVDIAIAAAGRRDVRPTALPLARRSGRSDYVLLLAPWHAAEPSVDAAVQALVVIHDADAQPPLPVRLLQDGLGLTIGEAKVAACIADGLTPQQAAGRLGVSLSTVRTHLRAIYRKTSTVGQVELARRAAAIAAAATRAAELAAVARRPATELVQADETENFTARRIAVHDRAPSPALTD